MLPLKTTTSQFLTLTQELVLGMDVGVPMVEPELPRAARPGRPLSPGGRPWRRGAGHRFRRRAKARRGGSPRGGRPFVEDRRRARQDADGAGPVCDGDDRGRARPLAAPRSAPRPALRGRRARARGSELRRRGRLAARGGSRRRRAPHPGIRGGRQRHDSRRGEPAPQGVDGVLLGAAPGHRRPGPGHRGAVAVEHGDGRGVRAHPRLRHQARARARPTCTCCARSWARRSA